MLTVVDKPLIEYAVDEARSAGISHFVFVIAPGRTEIKRHFFRDEELEQLLEAKGKTRELDCIRQMSLSPDEVSFPVQRHPRGLGHAVFCAREHVGNQPFAVISPDDLVQGPKSCMEQLAQLYEEVGGNILAIEEVPLESVDRYGVLVPGATRGNVIEVRGMIEKPSPAEAPSRLAVIGRYILSSTIFDYLAQEKIGIGGEIQLTDAMEELLGVEEFHGLKFEGRRYDCGNKAGYIAANIAYSAQDEQFVSQVRELVSETIMKI